EFTGWHMLAVMVLFFGTIISVNLTLAWFAAHSWTGLVVKNSYVASQEFNEKARMARAQSALGHVGRLESRDGEIAFSFLDAAGRPVTTQRVEVKVGRPTHQRDDRVLVLDHAGAGEHTAAAVLAPGIWQADVTARLSDGTDWRQHWRLSIAGEPDR
ncbi:MAG: FixH family protein, partial [Pseudomonadota bacterium]|nr:FixH family protein [Pseudomonadota bacterium]